MSLLTEFRKRTFEISKQLPNVKVSTLRLAEAKSHGYQSVQSYMTHLADTDLKSHLITNSDIVIPMTDNVMESLFGSDASFNMRLFRSMNLDFQVDTLSAFDLSDSFYPLTKEEENFIDPDGIVEIDDWCFELKSTVILNGKKHISVVYYDYFEVDTTETKHTESYIKLQVDLLKMRLLISAQKLNGKLEWSNEPKWYDKDQGYFITTLYVPFDEAMKKTSNAKEFASLIEFTIRQATCS